MDSQQREAAAFPQRSGQNVQHDGHKPKIKRSLRVLSFVSPRLRGERSPLRVAVQRFVGVLDTLSLELADRAEPDLTWIVDDLAIGGRILDDEWPRLRAAGLDAVVDCRAEARDPEHLLLRLGIVFLHVPTPDSSDFTDQDVASGVAWIDAQRAVGRRVLVHCRAGKGRSVLLGAAALAHRGLAPDDALALIRSRRPRISPTPGQIARLRAYADTIV